MYTVLICTLVMYTRVLCILVVYTLVLCRLVVCSLLLCTLILWILIFFYMLLFFSDHLNNNKRIFRVSYYLNMIEIKYRYHCAKLKIRGWYHFHQLFCLNRCRKWTISNVHIIYVIFFFNLLIFEVCFYLIQKV